MKFTCYVIEVRKVFNFYLKKGNEMRVFLAIPIGI